jgi:Circularly permuted ATP-grasp type 2/A predicted alpha-helical domain with a conserved ER motif.
VPRVLGGEEWGAIKRGLAQRIRALNHFVDDVYHGREIVRDGIVPWRLVASRSHFARADATPSISFGSGGLLALLGDVDERMHRTEALGELTLDGERPGSMLASIERARRGALTVRDAISADMWEAINTTTLGLRGAASRVGQRPRAPTWRAAT